MASISTDGKGNRRILFVDKARKRRCVRLGKMPMKSAEKVCTKIEALNSAETAGNSPDRETAEWLRTRDTRLYDKLAAVGLAPERAAREASTLGLFLDRYLAARTDIKPGTRVLLERVRASLVEHFGAGKLLAAISPGDADEFRLHLQETIGENTVRRMCGRAKQFFRAAVRKRLIDQNPFADMRDCTVQANRSREYFLSRDDADKVLAACPDADWRLIFVLARYGGLRCPSEHLGLTWGCVDWERGRLRVPSPKTERHEGREARWIPLFPEIHKELDALWQQIPEGTPGDAPIVTRYRLQTQNLRTTLKIIIRRAGLEPWPKLFQNLRSTRETELAETFPIHVVCAWLGNTTAIAAKHYLQVTEEHFAKASEKAARKQAQYAAVTAGIDEKPESSAKQNYPAVPLYTAAHGEFSGPAGVRNVLGKEVPQPGKPPFCRGNCRDPGRRGVKWRFERKRM
ncbi:MAG TPA: tyrosine-type recombinase/integrase [Pirellulales bacterium]|jgi:integrase